MTTAAPTPSPPTTPTPVPMNAKEITLATTRAAQEKTVASTFSLDAETARSVEELDQARREKTQDPEALLLRMTEQPQRITFDTEEQTKRRVDERGAKDTAGNEVKNHPFNITKTAAERAKTVAEGRFTDLDPAIQRTVVDFLVAGVLERRGIFAEFDPAEVADIQRSVIERLINDVSYQKEVGRLLYEKLGPEATDRGIESAKTALQQADQALEQAEQEGFSLSEIAEALEEFEDTSATGGQKGTKFARLEKLQGVGVLMRSAAWVEKQLRDLDRKYPPNDPKSQLTLGGKIAEVKVKIEQGTTKGNFGDAFSEQLAEILVNDEVQDIHQEQRNLQKQGARLLDLQQRVDEAAGTLTRQEERFANEIENIIVEAGNNIYNKELRELIGLQQERTREAIKNAKDEDERRIEQGISDNWDVEEYKDGRAVPAINKTNVTFAFGNLMTRGVGPDAIIEGFLRGKLTELERRGITRGMHEYDEEELRIEKKLKDEQFMAPMRTRVAQELINRYVLSGEKVRRGDVMYLRRTKWGMEAIKNALAEQTRVKADLDQAYAQGVLKEDFWHWLARKSNKNVPLALLLLLPIVGAFGAAGIAGKIQEQIG